MLRCSYQQIIRTQPNGQATDDTIMTFILIGVQVFEAVIGIASVIRKGVLKDQRVLLMKKTNAELRSMLHGVNQEFALNPTFLVLIEYLQYFSMAFLVL